MNIIFRFADLGIVQILQVLQIFSQFIIANAKQAKSFKRNTPVAPTRKLGQNGPGFFSDECLSFVSIPGSLEDAQFHAVGIYPLREFAQTDSVIISPDLVED